MNRILTSICLLLCLQTIDAQSFLFGPKLGPSIGIQQWDNFEKDPLFAFHGAMYIESYDEDNLKNSLFAQIGYHVRGSANRYIGSNGNFSQNFKFNNVALVLGAKHRFKRTPKVESYYSFGIRAEYTLSTNLDDFTSFNSVFLPQNEFVRKFIYGLNVGAGMEFPISEFVSGILELNISPDLSLQYDQQALGNVLNPWGPGTITLNERRIRNVSVEISMGFRFLRKIEYID